MKSTDSGTKGACKIIKCSCDMGNAAAYQDAKYGKGNRVGNPTKKDTYRCTVCGKEH